MLRPISSKAFEKDIERAKKRGWDISRFVAVSDLLIAELPLPPERRNHKLVGNWKGWQECHISADWILIYRIETPFILFERTGSHSDLFD